jgi:T5orf172 domain
MFKNIYIFINYHMFIILSNLTSLSDVLEKSLRVLSLENNQKNKHLCSKGKYIYVLKSSLNDYIDEDKPDTLRIGKTKKYKIRLNTYNSGIKDNTIVLYRAKTNDISAVENCLKGLLSKKVYRSYREYYNITLREAIHTIKKCIKLTGSKLISEDKFYHKYKLSKSSRLNGFNYGLSNTECQNNQTDQKGGTYSDFYNNENFADEVCPISFDNSLQKSSQTIKSYTYYAGLYEAFNNLMNIIKVN